VLFTLLCENDEEGKSQDHHARTEHIERMASTESHFQANTTQRHDRRKPTEFANNHGFLNLQTGLSPESFQP
jgi:hypothetical protein